MPSHRLITTISFAVSISKHSPRPNRSNESNLHRPLNPTVNLLPPMFRAPSLMLAATVQWLRVRRSRYLFLVLCSPILLPFLCLVGAADLCLRFCYCFRRPRARGKAAREESEDERMRRAEEGRCGAEDVGDEEEIGLLQRYLEDQLMLVGSVYECGDDCDDSCDGDGDGGFLNRRQPRTPLLA